MRSRRWVDAKSPVGYIAHGEKGDATGICKVQFERAEKPRYDHISIRQFVGSGFFFLTESKMWMRR